MMRVAFENTCTALGSEIFPGLFQDFMDGYIKPEGSSL